jgi:hypothetical protein
MNRDLKRLNLTGPRVSILHPGYVQLQLQSVLNALNRDYENRPIALDNSSWGWRKVNVSERKEEICRLIAQWESSGRNLEKLFRLNPELEKSCTTGKAMLIPARDGVAQLAWMPDLTGYRSTPLKIEALRLFIEFLANPLSLSVGGPCKRCGIFYKKSDPRQKTYCKGKCGPAATAGKATKDRRDREYQAKLAPVQLAVRKWEERPRKGHWKKWVARETGQDPRFITQAVTRGKLIPPFGES